VQFEVVLATFFVQQRRDRHLRPGDEGLPLGEGFSSRPDHLPSELDPDTIDAFIIPGGEPKVIMEDPVLAEKLREIDARGKLLAAICAGPFTSRGQGC
jgi:transcriptional regulator GlxA family with amidase domain